MIIRYSKNEVVDRLNRYYKGMEDFYKIQEVNWTGQTPGKAGPEYYSEIICEWLLQPENLNRLQSAHTVTRSHTCVLPFNISVLYDSSCDTMEQKISWEFYRQGFVPEIGFILDDQTKLRDNETHKVKKIGLLAYDPFDNVLRILKMNKPDNQEDSLLFCCLEAYNYGQIVKREQLIAEYNDRIHSDRLMRFRMRMDSDQVIATNAALVTSPVIFRRSRAHFEWEGVKSGLFPQLGALLEKLEMVPIVIEAQYVRVP